MMKGRLTLDHTPCIPVTIVDSLRWLIIDTGFGGALYLSEDHIASLNLPFLTTAPIVLANQSVVISDVFEATVMWFSVARRVAVIAGPVGSDGLVGMELLKVAGSNSMTLPLKLGSISYNQPTTSRQRVALIDR